MLLMLIDFPCILPRLCWTFEVLYSLVSNPWSLLSREVSCSKEDSVIYCCVDCFVPIGMNLSLPGSVKNGMLDFH